MKTLWSVLFLLALSAGSRAQSRQDLIACLELVLSDPAMQPAFQHDLPGGPAVVILREEAPEIGDSPLEHYFRELTPEDFHLHQQVLLLSPAEFRQLDIPEAGTLNVGMSFQPDKQVMMVFLQTTLLYAEPTDLQGWFRLKKENGEWRVINRQVHES